METVSPSTQALPAGTRLEEFVIERVLGSGGFGMTYLARDTRLDRKVVIKENLPVQFCFRDTHSLTVAPRHTQGDDADNFQWSLENFSKEAAMLASLDHPGIVKVLRSFEAFGTAYFVMPFVEGVALDELAKERVGKPFSEEELRGLLERVLSALAYLHERGIYHRDIKPGNILTTSNGAPVLIDFGSARQRLSERSLTVIESHGYTPFEQLQTRGNIGPWSDLYALGATLVKVMTGEAPPKTNDRSFGDPWLPLAGRAELTGRFSKAFLTTIDRSLKLPIEERWQDAGEWQAALRGQTVAKPAATRPKHEPEAILIVEVPKSAADYQKKPNFIPWIVGACVVSGLIAVASLIGEREESRRAANEAALQQERDNAEAADAAGVALAFTLTHNASKTPTDASAGRLPVDVVQAGFIRAYESPLFSLDESRDNYDELIDHLKSHKLPYPDCLPPGLVGVKSLGCRELVIDGKRGSLVCFDGRENDVVHLVIFRREDVDGELPARDHPAFSQEGHWATARWEDDRHVFILFGITDVHRMASLF
jgi:serine/threonine protein kinase